MSKRSNYSPEEKINILELIDTGEYSLAETCLNYNINQSTISRWRQKIERYGLEGLNKEKYQKEYSKELKLAAIQDYQSGQYSLREVCKKYEISNDGVLFKWITKYNSHREIKATKRGKSQSMTKGRTTTWEERADIVKYCLENDKDYQMAADIYKVSYQQVYQWVKKYEDGGDDALKDKRGRKKTEEELTTEEKFKLEMKKLERENERLRAENAFLKKLEELERRR
jgi:transposase